MPRNTDAPTSNAVHARPDDDQTRPDGPDPQRRSPTSHRAILDATIALLEEGGYQALTIEGVARRAGVGKQTIYRWWDGSRAALVLEAFQGAGEERIRPPDSGDVRTDLVAILRPVFALHTDREAGTALANRTLMAEAQRDPDFHARYRRLHEHWMEPMRDAVRRGIDRGQLRDDVDPGVVVDLLQGASWYRLLLDHAPLDDRAADEMVDTVLDGCRT